jgi:hypothetical protein
MAVLDTENARKAGRIVDRIERVLAAVVPCQ